MTNSSYLRHLPEIYRAETPSFLGEYLKIFEAILGGRDDAEVDGERIVSLAERVERYVEHLDPARAPIDVDESGAVSSEMLSSEVLSYLASWVALALDQNWDLSKQRIWLSQIVPLYKRRGTLAGIRAYLNMFVGNQVTVDEPPGGFVIAESSTVAENTFIAGAPAYFFRVRIEYAFGTYPFDIDEWKNLHSGARAIVDLEKPAHTYYSLEARTPGFIVASRATIATDTLIWEASEPFT